MTGERQQWRIPKEQDLADDVNALVGEVASDAERLFVLHLLAVAREVHRTAPTSAENQP